MRAKHLATFLLLVAVAIIFRLPPILNSRAINSDAAVVGLQARHMLRGEWSCFIWGARYQGSLDAILAAGASTIFGSTAIVLMLVALAEFVAAMWFAFDICQRHAGLCAATVCASLLAINGFPINTTALCLPRQGAITLVLASLWMFDLSATSARRPVVWFATAISLLCIALWADLFIELFLPGVLIFAALCVKDSASRGAPWRRQLLIGAIVAAVGIACFLVVRTTAPVAGEQKTGLSLASIAPNASLLRRECLPFALGYKTIVDADDVTKHRLVSAPFPVNLVQTAAGWSLPALFIASVVIAMRGRSIAMRRFALLGIFTMITTIAGFLLSIMPRDLWAARYLAPIFWIAPIALIPVAARFGWRTLAAVVTPLVVALATAGWASYDMQVDGLMPRMTARGRADNEMRLADFLRARNIHACASSYWLAYRLTFLFDENPIIVPMDVKQNRYVPYRKAYLAAPIEVAIFHPFEPRQTPETFENLLKARHIHYERHEVAGFTVLIVPR